MTKLTNPGLVLDAVNDLDFPASKQQVVEHAERSGAGDQVLAAVRALPLGDYANRDELVRSLPTTPSMSASEKATKARNRSHPGVAEHLRAPRE